MGFHLVPPPTDLAHQLGVPCHVLTQTEEGRGEGECIEAVKDIGCGAGVRTVVEGERHPVFPGPTPPTEVAG